MYENASLENRFFDAERMLESNQRKIQEAAKEIRQLRSSLGKLLPAEDQDSLPGTSSTGEENYSPDQPTHSADSTEADTSTDENDDNRHLRLVKR
jgi:hypothetical protein